MMPRVLCQAPFSGGKVARRSYHLSGLSGLSDGLGTSKPVRGSRKDRARRFCWGRPARKQKRVHRPNPAASGPNETGGRILSRLSISRTDSSGPFWPSSRCAGGKSIATWPPCLARDGKVLAGRSLTPCGIDRYDASSTLPSPFFWWQSGKEVLPPGQPRTTAVNP